MERRGQPHDITKDGWLPSPTHPLQPPYCWDQDRILPASLTNTHFGYLAQDKEHIHAIPDAVLTDPGHARFGKSHLSRHRMSGTRSVESTSAKLSKDISFVKITFEPSTQTQTKQQACIQYLGSCVSCSRLHMVSKFQSSINRVVPVSNSDAPKFKEISRVLKLDEDSPADTFGLCSEST